MSAQPSAAGLLITYTIFDDVHAYRKTERADAQWSGLVDRIRTAPTYIEKHDCPLISLCDYGEVASPKGSLRHDANVLRVYGVEIDYDAGEVQPVEAARRLQSENIDAVVVTTPSHTPDRPRFRVFAPFSEPQIPICKRELTGRLNRVLGGIAAPESFRLAQSYYVGRVRGVEYTTHTTHGRCVDLAADIEPLFPSGAKRDAPPDSYKPLARGAAGARVAGFVDLLATLERVGLYLGVATGGWHHVICPWAFTHTGADTSGGAISEPAAANRWAGGFRCHHGHCATRSISDLYRWARAQRCGAA